tara:strand:- start:16 stop:465 length:450 start_codon:yes stop_codon:yes gene_type:complete
MRQVRIYRVRPDAKLPVRAHKTDAGMDFFFCPPENAIRRLQSGDTALLETGVKVEVPPGFMLQIMNKSGIASKMQLITGACVVDEGYDGEIFVNLQNIGKAIQYIEPGQKIAQGVFVRIEKPQLWEIQEDKVYGGTTSRGEGGFGSTGV